MEERQRSHVLLVDDEIAFTKVLAKVLEHQGFVTSSAASAGEALEFLQMVEPDVIVLDVRMPGLSGVDALPRIRAVCPRAPVILLTGHATLDDAARAVEQGAFDVLHKPCDTAILVTRLREAVQTSRGRNLHAGDILVPVDQCLVTAPSWSVGQTLGALEHWSEDTVVLLMEDSALQGIWDPGLWVKALASRPWPTLWRDPVASVCCAPSWVDAHCTLVETAAQVALHGIVAVGMAGSLAGVIGPQQLRAAAVRWGWGRGA
jgi:DNA-binding response OmpR family regulator